MERAVWHFRTWVDLPPAALNPNNKPVSRGAALRRADAVRRYRAHALERARLVLDDIPGELTPQPWTSPVTVQAVFHFPTARHRDEDNLGAMLKPVWDALQAPSGLLPGAGLYANDGQITARTVRTVVDRECDFGAVQIDVWGLPAGGEGGGDAVR